MRRRTMAFGLAFVLAALTAQPASTAPDIVDLPNTPLMSSNVRHLANFPAMGTGVGGHFMGKYFFMTSARSGSFLPGNAGPGGVLAFDATAPETPKLVGFLPLPHWENEDVDLSAERKILLVTVERIRQGNCEANVPAAGLDPSTCPVVPPQLYVIDISDPANMKVRSQVAMPAYIGKTSKGALMRGPGHIAQCVLRCRYAYVTGARNGGVHVYDLRNLDNVRLLGEITNSPAGVPNSVYPERGTIHDANVDPMGNVWFTGSGGTAMYAPPSNPLKLKLLAFVKAVDNKYNALLHHGSLRLDKSMVMVNEESYSGQCGHSRNPADEVLRDDEQQGSFQIWRIGSGKLAPVSMWKTEADEYTEGGGTVILSCSAHWFSINRHKIVAIAWYGQGIRFLDVSNPRAIRQVGYFIGPGSEASAAYHVPWRPDLVYSVDYNRGLDVIQIDRGGRRSASVVAPMRAEWFADYQGIRFTPPMGPDPDFGYACRRPALTGF